MTNIENKIKETIENKVNQLGYEIYDIEYVKEGKNYYLRVYIDKESGIDLNDCECVNNEITDILDTIECLKEPYFLEISSPGIERVLKTEEHLKQNIGKKVEVKLYSAINNNKVYYGILKDFEKDNITVTINEAEDMKFEINKIALIKTIFDW